MNIFLNKYNYMLNKYNYMLNRFIGSVTNIYWGPKFIGVRNLLGSEIYWGPKFIGVRNQFLKEHASDRVQ